MFCKFIDSCAIFKHYLADKPQQAQQVMDKYCKKDYESCARYRLSKIISEDAVPLKLFPDMINIANQLINNAEKQRKSDITHSQVLINNIQPQDIFDFALDLLSESTDNVMAHSYRAGEQTMRKFSLWFKTDLQNYYARIIQIKIKHTGIRSRKRGKNPLTFFLENLRRGRPHSESLRPRPQKPEDVCAFHFESLKIRIALFKGLQSKPLHPDIIDAIESLLSVEEERFNLGAEGLVKKFTTQTN